MAKKASDRYTPDERETVIILNDLGEITVTTNSEHMRSTLRRWLGKPAYSQGETDTWLALEEAYDVRISKRSRPPTIPAKLARERATFLKKRDGVPAQTI